MSIYFRECSICKEKFRVNGETSMRFIINDHIKDKHPEEYQKLCGLRYDITTARNIANAYERMLGF